MKFLVLLLGLISLSSFSQSRPIDAKWLNSCGGKVELRKSSYRQFHVKLKNVRNCSNVLIKASRYGHVIDRYKLTTADYYPPYTASYTLSHEAKRHLRNRGKIFVTVKSNSSYHEDGVSLRSRHGGGGGYPKPPTQCGGHSGTNYTGYAKTNSCQCAYYYRGQFQYHVQEYLCRSYHDPKPPTQCGGHSGTNYTGYAKTNSCRCAYYRRGQFQYHVSESYCRRW